MWKTPNVARSEYFKLQCGHTRLISMEEGVRSLDIPGQVKYCVKCDDWHEVVGREGRW